MLQGTVFICNEAERASTGDEMKSECGKEVEER